MLNTFDAFHLHPEVLEGLAALGIASPTPVQRAAIPLVMDGRDAIVQAKTGSGKTFSYLLPAFSLFDPEQRPQVLVVVPTRELAVQVVEAAASINPHEHLRVLAVYGGVGINPQEVALAKGIDLVVGTPGRLKDLHARGSLNLTGIRLVVLDEADEMLNMGFRPDMEFLLGKTAGREQTLLLSATMPAAIEAIARTHLKDPAIVKPEAGDEVPAELDHYFLRLEDKSQSFDALVTILGQERPERAVIFTRSKWDTKRIAERLEKRAGLKAGYLGGHMSQSARLSMLARFKDGEFQFLVATDVAARGLDIDGITHVIHLTVPEAVETYLHRSGRTARAGQAGKAIVFVTPDFEDEFGAIRAKLQHVAELNVALPAPSEVEITVPAAAPAPRRERQAERRPAPAPAPPAPRAPRQRAEAARIEPAPAKPRQASIPTGELNAPPGRAPRRGNHARPAAAPQQEPTVIGVAEAGTALAADSDNGRPSTGPLVPLPRHQTSWRQFRLALAPGHKQTRDSLHGWLAQRTGVPRSSIRSIVVHADHAMLEVESRSSERFVAVFSGGSRA